MRECLDLRSLSGDCATLPFGRLPLVDATRHDVLIAIARGAGIRKASDHFFAAVALHGNDSIGHVVGFDAENLPALGQPDLPTACLQQGENAKEGQQFRGQHDAAIMFCRT